MQQKLDEIERGINAIAQDERIAGMVCMLRCYAYQAGIEEAGKRLLDVLRIPGKGAA